MSSHSSTSAASAASAASATSTTTTTSTTSARVRDVLGSDYSEAAGNLTTLPLEVAGALGVEPEGDGLVRGVCVDALLGAYSDDAPNSIPNSNQPTEPTPSCVAIQEPESEDTESEEPEESAPAPIGVQICQCFCETCKSSHGNNWVGCEDCDKSWCTNCGRATFVEEPEDAEPESEEPEHEVQEIVAHRHVDGNIECRIRWVGFDVADDTWEPRANFLGDVARLMVEQYTADIEDECVVCLELIGEDDRSDPNSFTCVHSSGVCGPCVLRLDRPRSCPLCRDRLVPFGSEDEDDGSESEEYEVHAITLGRGPPGNREYFVSWVGHGFGDNSWEPEANLDGAMVEAYERDIRAPGYTVGGHVRAANGAGWVIPAWLLSRSTEDGDR